MDEWSVLNAQTNERALQKRDPRGAGAGRRLAYQGGELSKCPSVLPVPCCPFSCHGAPVHNRRTGAISRMSRLRVHARVLACWHN